MEFSDYLGIITNIVIAVPTTALVLLWLIFKLYLREYEIDFKSLLVISYKTFGTFAAISFFPLLFFLSASSPYPSFIMYLPLAVALPISFFIARRLFMKSGMEKEETRKVIVPWFAIMLAIAIAAVSVLAFQERPAGGGFDTKKETVFYIKPQGANVRSCPSTSCEIIGEMWRDSTYVSTSYSSLDSMPDWVPVSYTDARTGEKISGYINKVVLSEFPVE